jgi:hypothetical protein
VFAGYFSQAVVLQAEFPQLWYAPEGVAVDDGDVVVVQVEDGEGHVVPEHRVADVVLLATASNVFRPPSGMYCLNKLVRLSLLFIFGLSLMLSCKHQSLKKCSAIKSSCFNKS